MGWPVLGPVFRRWAQAKYIANTTYRNDFEKATGGTLNGITFEQSRYKDYYAHKRRVIFIKTLSQFFTGGVALPWIDKPGLRDKAEMLERDERAKIRNKERAPN